MQELNDDAIAAHAEFGPQIPTVQSVLHIYPTDGAVHRRLPDTAYSHRDAKFVHIIAATSPDPADMPAAPRTRIGRRSILTPAAAPTSTFSWTKVRIPCARPTARTSTVLWN
ncbi:MAG: hypothetical protein R3A10_02120 [Caldilineaceae bacterium]